MKIYDIAQEVFGCQVFAGDPAPEKKQLCSIEKGDLCNLTAFGMCAHNGTHIDAPFHFIKGGKTVDSIGLDTFVGMAYVYLEFLILACTIYIKCAIIKSVSNKIYYERLNRNEESKMPNTQS